ncbi:hypothetical protein BDN71DRAFT_1448929 [Pleurotus eryngii]|uniref:DUF6593 domain-containing protein n=1 Tax=Pleurotus eryngii TaxID=5323 RepID=A0A9P5ZWE8_PLEER|nr:hypothetical protein BDN71DRAFT_1448929 [Pleurotus eryngii]
MLTVRSKVCVYLYLPVPLRPPAPSPRTASMKLYLSRNSPLNATLVDDLGQELYYIHTPWKLSGRTTTITKADKELEAFVKFGGLLISDSKSDISPSDDLSTRGQPELAQIHWRCIGSSRLNFGGFERDIHEYLVRSGFMGWYRTFTAPDGRSYRWTMGFNYPELYTNDEHRRPIARFHRRRLSIPGICKGRAPHLEILPDGEQIADAIVMTFVYVEKRRRDCEKARSAGD